MGPLDGHLSDLLGRVRLFGQTARAAAGDVEEHGGAVGRALVDGQHHRSTQSRPGWQITARDGSDESSVLLVVGGAEQPGAMASTCARIKLEGELHKICKHIC